MEVGGGEGRGEGGHALNPYKGVQRGRREGGEVGGGGGGGGEGFLSLALNHSHPKSLNPKP